MTSNQSLLKVENLHIQFNLRRSTVHAVNDVSFELQPGEILGIVGESGCGKSVTCYSLLGLLPSPPATVPIGKAFFNGIDLLQSNQSQLNQIRGNRISMIFQDPMTSLNPYLKIKTQLTEPLLLHGLATQKQAKDKAQSILDEVGLPQPDRILQQYPHELSGGMRQRVMIAMAMITEPDLLIADEPTTALDVTVQAQILKLIQELQAKRKTAVLFITHDLGVAANICDRVLVMYAGEIAEVGKVKNLFTSPKHPYSLALQKANPAITEKSQKLYSLAGMPPSLTEAPKGCTFYPRCQWKTERCMEKPTQLEKISEHQATNCVRIQKGEISLNVNA